MNKKILVALGLLVLFLFSIEIIKLLQLKGSVSRYAEYWKQQANNQGEFTYVALGDSAAQGIGASKPELGYVGLLARQIQQQTGKTVRVVNLSVTGARINDLVQNQLPQLKIYKPDLTTVEIGSNDVANNYNSQKFQQQYNQMASLLPAGTIVANIPYFGGRLRLNTQAVNASKHIQETAQKHNLKLVDLQSQTRQKQSILNYAADYFHPSNRGYKNWETAFWTIIRPVINK
jgi:acyl-CoA thioesterase-1